MYKIVILAMLLGQQTDTPDIDMLKPSDTYKSKKACMQQVRLSKAKIKKEGLEISYAFQVYCVRNHKPRR